MEINKDYIDSLSSLSDDELRERIKAAAKACGIDEKRAAASLGDMSSVKKKLRSLSESQIKAAVSAVGEDKIDKIRSELEHGKS